MMKTLHVIVVSVFLAFALQSAAAAQSINLSETFKKSFNETVQEVRETENAAEKRTLLNDSFSKMIKVIERIESEAKLSADERAWIGSYKSDIVEKKRELNGVEGFNRVQDKDLNNFTDYSQNHMEQADKTITIGLTTILIIILILILV